MIVLTELKMMKIQNYLKYTNCIAKPPKDLLIIPFLEKNLIFSFTLSLKSFIYIIINANYILYDFSFNNSIIIIINNFFIFYVFNNNCYITYIISIIIFIYFYFYFFSFFIIYFNQKK